MTTIAAPTFNKLAIELFETGRTLSEREAKLLVAVAKGDGRVTDGELGVLAHALDDFNQSGKANAVLSRFLDGGASVATSPFHVVQGLGQEFLTGDGVINLWEAKVLTTVAQQGKLTMGEVTALANILDDSPQTTAANKHLGDFLSSDVVDHL
jgi:hypothetical protein